MKNIRNHFLLALSLLFTIPAFAQEYKYEKAENDPLNARIYTLDNGLKVYMTVYKDAPRIQTYIATRAGSKNDPKDATGLAHYLEHMVFKGTDKYGTKDPEKELALIQKIEDLYEVYRKTTDEAKRKAIYHEIDSISGVASTYAIANEYDKMLSSIGATGTNAYTWVEQTVYVNNIPSNQLEKWLTIESERFRKPVLRLFHTELEAVYEEKNRGLDSDSRKLWEAMLSGAFPKHPYGTQTTIGTIDHLKNPSMLEIRKYFDTYYVPNNMAICLSGDLDPDATIKMIDEKFGSWKRKPVPVFGYEKDNHPTAPVVKEVVGPDAENVALAFRFNGLSDQKQADLLSMISKIVYNGKAGMLDLNLNQQQKVLSSNSFVLEMNDYSLHVFGADAKQGQTLEEAKDLVLEQIEKLKKGEFDDWLLSAIINNMKLQQIKSYESNNARADAFVSSFINGIPWQDYVNKIDRLSKITKDDIVKFANEHYKNNYVIVYKRTGEDTSVQKVVKPEITPVSVNRDDQSQFVKNVLALKNQEIEPAFLDYEKDIQKFKIKNDIEVLYNKNTENQLFTLYYVVDMGKFHNKKLPIAIDYLEYLGTSKYTPVQLKQEMYKLGSSVGVSTGNDQSYVYLSGLQENFDKSVALFEELLADPQPNDEALKNLVSDIKKGRADSKLNKQNILYGAMYSYGVYGKRSPFTDILSEAELDALKSEDLLPLIKELTSYQHHMLYYGPNDQAALTSSLNKLHNTPEKLKAIPEPVQYPELESTKNVYVVDYDMKQAEIVMLSRSEKYNKDNVPLISMYNSYFGGGMSSIVFQEMRESKALAYSVYSTYRTPGKLDKHHYVMAYIGTQADKLPEAIAGLMDLINNMPKAELTFETARNAVLQKIRTQRISKTSLLWNYESAKDLGLDFDMRKNVYEGAQKFTFEDIQKFQQEYLKDKTYTMLVLGKKDNLDLKTLEKYGKVTFLTLEDIFGY